MDGIMNFNPIGEAVIGEMVYTIPEAAKRLGVTRKTVWNWVKLRRYFPNAQRKDPMNKRSHVIIPLSDIEDFEKKRDELGVSG
jgi:hypothetical protein